MAKTLENHLSNIFLSHDIFMPRDLIDLTISWVGASGVLMMEKRLDDFNKILIDSIGIVLTVQRCSSFANINVYGPSLDYLYSMVIECDEEIFNVMMDKKRQIYIIQDSHINIYSWNHEEKEILLKSSIKTKEWIVAACLDSRNNIYVFEYKNPVKMFDENLVPISTLMHLDVHCYVYPIMDFENRVYMFRKESNSINIYNEDGIKTSDIKNSIVVEGKTCDVAFLQRSFCLTSHYKQQILYCKRDNSKIAGFLAGSSPVEDDKIEWSFESMKDEEDIESMATSPMGNLYVLTDKRILVFG